MSQIDPARIRSVLASEGLTASYGDPKLDVPDGRREVSGLYKKLQRFEKDHRSTLTPKGKKALDDALDSLVNLNAHLASLSASLYTRLAGKTASDVGQTILRQMGGARRLSMMVGAKDFVVYKAKADSEYGEGMGAAAFKFPRPGRGKPNYVKIVLNGRDYYDVTFGSIHGYKFKPMKEYTDISASGLQSLFERETGLYLTF